MIKYIEFHQSEDYLTNYSSKELGYLKHETFFITNFIERYIWDKKIKCKKNNAEKITSLVINLNSSENKLDFSYKNTLCVNLKDEYSSVLTLRGVSRIEKFLYFINKASDLIIEFDSNLSETIKNSVLLFKYEDYKNIWIHRRKKIKNIGSVELECNLSAFDFVLKLIVKNKELGEIYSKEILQTRGSTTFYYDLFDKIEIKNSIVSILDRISEEPIYTISTDDIVNNKSGIFPKNDIWEETMVIDEDKNILIDSLPKLNPRKSNWWCEFKSCYFDLESKNSCPDF